MYKRKSKRKETRTTEIPELLLSYKSFYNMQNAEIRISRNILRNLFHDSISDVSPFSYAVYKHMSSLTNL